MPTYRDIHTILDITDGTCVPSAMAIDVSALMDSEIMNNLPIVAERHELYVFVKELIAKLEAKLQKLWQTATSVRPLSLIYEKKWVKAWKDDVLSPTTAEISSYEADVIQGQVQLIRP